MEPSMSSSSTQSMLRSSHSSKIRSCRKLLLSTLMGSLVEAQIHIISPKTLKDEFQSSQAMIYGTTATFGAPYFGSRVLGKVYYAESNGDQYCSADDYKVKSEESTELDREGSLMPVLLLKRGNCSFAKKVKIAAENKNAAAVIIVDKTSSTKTADQIQATIMADDESGTGQSIKIPSILISHFEGDRLIQAVRKADEEHESVIIKLAWDIPQSQYVMVDLWFSSGSREANRFLHEFSEIAETFKEEMSFVPHYHIISLPSDSDDAASLCLPTTEKTEKNKFCAPDPDGPGAATGRMVVEEDLRQLCVFKTTEKWRNPEVRQSGELFGYSENFWNYMTKFWSDCTDYGKDFSKFTKECSDSTMNSLGINIKAVHDCVQNDWRDLLVKELRNHAWSPLALRINGWRYSGPIETHLVTRSVCGAYLKRPEKCDGYMDLARSQYYYTNTGGSFISFANMCFLIGVVLVLVGTMFTVYKRYLTSSVRHALREEVMLEVRSQMADYAPLEDGPVPVREMKKFTF